MNDEEEQDQENYENESENNKEQSINPKNENECSNIGKSFQYSTTSYSGALGQRIKPKFIKLLSEIISNHLDPILDFLDLIDLAKMRRVNHLFQSMIHEYYQKRLKFEINLITAYQEENKEKTAIFMKNIDSQIPISNKNWLDFELASVTSKLQLLDRNILTKLRSIKSIGKLSDNIYAPFCIIFGYNKSLNLSTKNDTWKKTAGKILSDSNLIIKISNLDLENMSDSDMLSAFVYLNLPELDIDVIRKYSSDFAKFIIWCQAVVSYHILIHPYKYRNEQSSIAAGSDVYVFASKMNEMINRFYRFKRFLYNLNIVKIPLADYVFNLQHNRELPRKSESMINNLSPLNIANIFYYLPFPYNFKLMSVSKKFYEGFKCSIDLTILALFKEIYFFKLQAYKKISKQIPVIYSYSIFSNYFLMLDDILNSNIHESGLTFVPFLTKENLNNLKYLKLNTEIVNSISKIFCIITNQKPERKQNQKGEMQYMYVDKVRSLVLSGKILKIMRNVNKLSLSEQRMKIVINELTGYSSLQRLENVKRINHGLYQLLIWELFVLEYLRSYNPFDFINLDYIVNRYQQEEIDMVKYYIEIMDYLKNIFKIKYHFSNAGNSNICPSFGIGKLNQELRKFLILHNSNENNEVIFKTTNTEQDKIANLYFESKEQVPLNGKPKFYEKIMIKILSYLEKDEDYDQMTISNNDTNNNQLDVIQEENKVFQSQNLSDNIPPSANANIISYSKNDNPFNQSNSSNPQIYLNIPKAKMKLISNNESSLFSSKKNQYKEKSKFLSIPNEVIIKNILFYLDINILPKFALVCHKTNDCIKTHIFIRLFFLNKEKKVIEVENAEIIKSIEIKRQNFFAEYEMQAPQKENAYYLMNQITSDDIMEIKQCFKKYNKNYEILIAPLLILLGERSKQVIRPDGRKEVSYFQTAKSVLFKNGFVKRIRDMELETIPSNIFKAVEKLIENPAFSLDKPKQWSPCFYRLISWVNGVIEFHKVIRKYSLSSYDYEILNDREIEFCKEMDNIILFYYKLLRFATKHCKEYESDAQEIMAEMNIQNENI